MDFQGGVTHKNEYEREEKTTCQMGNGLLLEASGAMEEYREVEARRESRRYKKRFLAWAGCAGGVGRQAAKEERGRGHKHRSALCIKQRSKHPAFSILKNVAYLLTKMKIDFSNVLFPVTPRASKAFHVRHTLARRIASLL